VENMQGHIPAVNRGNKQFGVVSIGFCGREIKAGIQLLPYTKPLFLGIASLARNPS
jgi:hypothetical protein